MDNIIKLLQGCKNVQVIADDKKIRIGFADISDPKNTDAVLNYYTNELHFNDDFSAKKICITFEL